VERAKWMSLKMSEERTASDQGKRRKKLRGRDSNSQPSGSIRRQSGPATFAQ